MAAIMTRPRISQETFDEAVTENIEEFEQTVEEALADAVEQFTNQGADLSLVVKTMRGRELSKEMQRASKSLEVIAGVQTLAECREMGNKTESTGGEEVDQLEKLTIAFRSVAALCKDGKEEAQVIASREGILGACALVTQLASVHLEKSGDDSKPTETETKAPVVTVMSQVDADEAKEATVVDVVVVEDGRKVETLLLAALETIAAIAMNNDETKEMLPPTGAKALCKCLSVAASLPANIVEAALEATDALCAKNERNKKLMHTAQLNIILADILSAQQDNENPAVFMSACKLLRRYLSDDDRRTGVEPGTFVRAREVGERKVGGVVAALCRALVLFQNESDHVSSILRTLKTVAVNEKICKMIAKAGGLQTSLTVYAKYTTQVTVALHGAGFFRAVSRTDTIKEVIGSGSGLTMLAIALGHHCGNAQVVEQVLGALNVLALRMPGNCQRIAEIDLIPELLSGMRAFPTHPGVQRNAIMAMRNMVSDWKTKNLCALMLEGGAEELINAAQQQHPMCKEVAFAALRDLGCKYEASYDTFGDE